MVTKGVGVGRDKLGVWIKIYTPIYKIDEQQGPTV